MTSSIHSPRHSPNQRLLRQRGLVALLASLLVHGGLLVAWPHRGLDTEAPSAPRLRVALALPPAARPPLPPATTPPSPPMSKKMPVQRTPPVLASARVPSTAPASRQTGARPPIAAAVALDPGPSLYQSALSQARQIAYDDSRREARSAPASIPPAWMGRYRGRWETDGARRAQDRGSFEVTISASGIATACIIHTLTVGDLPCSGALDATGDFSLQQTSAGITATLHGRVSGSNPVEISGRWVSSSVLWGSSASGSFKGTKGDWH